MSKPTSKFYFCIVLISTLAGCQNSSEQIEELNSSGKGKIKSIPIACKQPAQVMDIWKLEPILVKSGKINSSMTKEEKEKVIKSYISRKNDQYRLCLKSIKG